MSVQTHDDLPRVRVTHVSKEEWRKTIDAALAKLGLTFEDLSEQARRREFTSDEAQRIWVMTGGECP
jgi:hypothetical protein